MKKEQKRTLLEFKSKTPGRIVRVQVYYSLGGMNYFTGNVDTRGLYLSVVPIEVSPDGRMESFMAFSGYKQLVVPLKAFSAKKLAEYEPDLAAVNAMVDRVFAEQKLERWA